MGGVDMERHLGVGLTPPTLNHQEKPPDTQSTSGGVGGGRGQPRPLSRLEKHAPPHKLRRSDLSPSLFFTSLPPNQKDTAPHRRLRTCTAYRDIPP